jgi:hypothetical protein
MRIAVPTDMLTDSQIQDATRRARAIVSAVLVEHRNEFTIGWCAAFVQFGRIHVVQRARLAEDR